MYPDLSIQIGSFWRELPRSWKDHPEAKIPNHVEYVRPKHVLPLTLDYLDVRWSHEDNSRRSGWYVFFTGFHEDGPHEGETARGHAYREDAEKILTDAGLMDYCTRERDRATKKLVDDLRSFRQTLEIG